jgi:uncharacterized sulfatase
MIQTLDENVGRLLAKLDERKLTDRTLVVFTSDNGGYINEDTGWKVTDNSPLRSGKGSLYEGGIRVPLLMRLPGTTPANTVCDELVMCMDFFRTFTELAGTTGETATDGLSLTQLLRNPRTRLGRDTLFFHYPHYYPTTSPVSAVRVGDWKLLEDLSDGKVQLFNLKTDLGETHNLAEAQPEQARALRQRLAAWRESVGARMPTPNPALQDTRKQVRLRMSK